MKKLLIICACFAYSYLFAQNSVETSAGDAADIYWKSMPVKKTIKVNWLTDSPSFKITACLYDELFSRELRSWGIEFWKKFPNDPRRFDWFAETTQWRNEPLYFLDILEGVIAKNETKPGMFKKNIHLRKQWMEFYNAHREEFLESLPDDKRRNYLREEIGNKTYDCLWATEGEKFDFESLANKLKYYVTNYITDASQFATPLDIISNFPQGHAYPVTHPNSLGLTEADVFKYIGLLKSDNHPALQKVALQLEQRVKVQLNSMGLPKKDHEGKIFDIKHYKGKIVLVDLWSLGCGDCIAKMPEIKEVYEKYRMNGFEVISACLYGGNPDHISKILGVHEKIGADWKLLLLNQSKGEPGQILCEKFGFATVPQLFLLDADGKFLHYNDLLYTKGNLEKFVKQYLAK